MELVKKLHALEVSLTIGCKIDCLYCPQKLLLERYYGQNQNRKSKLSFEDFKRALDKVWEGGSISFCGMSEPFHNESCADMICYAFKRGYKISLFTTLSGMTIEDFEKIKNIKFESFVLHIPDAENYSKFAINEDYLKILKMINETMDIDYYSCHGTVSPVIENMIDRKKGAGLALGGRAGNLDIVEKDIDHEGRIICYHGSESQVGGWTPVMFPDGSLVLCCQDYGMKHILGNLLTQSWCEIRRGEEYQKFINGLKDDSIDILCRKCEDAKAVEDLPSIRLKHEICNRKIRGFNEKNELPFKVERVLKQFEKAETICVFGLGKLFHDHFYKECWDEGLNVSVFSDNNKDFHNKEIKGIKCVNPATLKEYPNVLVVVFVKNGESVIDQMHEMGIENCVLIEEVFEVCNFLCGEKFVKMTTYDR